MQDPSSKNAAVLRGSGHGESRTGGDEVPQQADIQLQHLQWRRDHC